MYSGEWLDGKREGHGTYRFANLNEYTGQWAANVKHGQGKCIYTSALDAPSRMVRWAPDGKSYAVGAKTAVLLFEEPEGTMHGLRTDKKYYVYVQQEGEQLKKDQMRAREMFAKKEGDEGDKAREKESCSCLWGNPCVDSSVCEDWHNRFEVAKKNGWKGF